MTKAATITIDGEARKLAKNIVKMAREKDGKKFAWSDSEVINDARRGIAIKMMELGANDKDKLESARQQGQAQFDSIKEMVERLQQASDGALEGFESATAIENERESAERTIHEDALSVQVRSEWYQPGASKEDTSPAEYEILLCTGGPACRIIGSLDQYGQPDSARMEVQDWFAPWTEIRPLLDSRAPPASANYNSEPVLLDYARCFYFGEG